jgi:hypothetical protein
MIGGAATTGQEEGAGRKEYPGQATGHLLVLTGQGLHRGETLWSWPR